MPHHDRPLMDPPPLCSFDQTFEAILKQPERKVSGLLSTGGISYTAHARISPRVGKYIEFPHQNRVYPCCWGNICNHMGGGGQRIGQYIRPLDEWCQSLIKKRSNT